MVVTIVSRSDEARRGHRHLAEDLSDRLPRYFQNIVFVEWTLDADGHKHEKVVHVNLHASHNFYRVTSSAETQQGPVTTEEHWSLSADGKVTTVITKFKGGFGQSELKLVLLKQ